MAARGAGGPGLRAESVIGPGVEAVKILGRKGDWAGPVLG